MRPNATQAEMLSQARQLDSRHLASLQNRHRFAALSVTYQLVSTMS